MCLGGFCGVSLNKDNLIKTSRLCLLFIVDTLFLDVTLEVETRTTYCFSGQKISAGNMTARFQ